MMPFKDKEKKKEYNKQYGIDYRDRNKDKIKEKEKKLYHKKIHDPAYKLRKRISIDINHALLRNKSNKSNLSCFKHLNYSCEQLKQHLESQFEPWMTWNNWGVYNIKTWNDSDNSTWTWNIDHIIPKSKFKYTSMKDIEFKKCWALENLRPIGAKQNILDGDKRKL